MKTQYITLVGLAFFSFASFQVAQAQITWGPLYGISGDSDISLDGTYVDAAGAFLNSGVTVDDSNTDVVFNGITGSNGSYTDGVDISFSSIEGIGGDQPYGHSADLPPDYYDALTGVTYVGDGGTPVTGTVTLSNLNSGDKYEVEVWQALPEGDDGNSDTTLTSVGGNSVTTTGYDYVVGTFDPTSDSQSFTFTAGASGVGEINAIELRDLGPATVPEPSTYALMAAGLIGLLFVSRRGRGVVSAN